MTLTLRTLMRQYPRAFYPQTWYEGEAFLNTPLMAPLRHAPQAARGYPRGVAPYPAVALADLYLRYPEAAAWHRYWWCRDRDAYGQQVYVGVNGRGFEIHRHLHLTGRWAVPA